MSFDLTGLPAEALAELKQLLSDKAADLFAICDQEDKGFVTKRDMQRMRAELPLDPDQLEAVFDKLDGDGNGYLTLEEFTDGFGEYLGLECASSAVRAASAGEAATGATDAELELEEEPPAALLETSAAPDEEDEFNMMLGELGILGLVEDDRALRDMWTNLRYENDPQLVANFEQFLANLSRDLHRKTSEQEHYESAVRNRTHLQEEQLKRLYEEMESQIGAERRQVREEEERREQRLREEWEAALQLKDQQVADALARMRGLEEQLEEARATVPEVREENAQLARERDALHSEVERQRILQREMQDHLDQLRSQTAAERKARATAALKVSEGIAQEREGIVQQLDFMKALNSKMLDERDVEEEEAAGGRGKGGEGSSRLGDELFAAVGPGEDGVGTVPSEHQGEEEVVKVNLDLSKFTGSKGRHQESNRTPSNGMLLPPAADLGGTSECEYDDEYFESAGSNANRGRSAGGGGGVGRPLRRSYKHYHSHSSHDSSAVDNVSLHDELAGLQQQQQTDSGRGSGGGIAGRNDDSSIGAADGEDEDEDDGGRTAAPEAGRRKRRVSLQRQLRQPSGEGSNGGARHHSSTLFIHHNRLNGNGDRGASRHPPESVVAQGDSLLLEDQEDSNSVTSCTGPVSFGEDDSDLASLNTRSTRSGHRPCHYVQPLSQKSRSVSSGDGKEPLAGYEPVRLPERVFKIIFIGDSCVGKTSLIRRFCTGDYSPEVKSTVGVDFHTRSVLVGAQSVCLQCWDTAGQERYRAITQQYFRKADAVVVVYDVTAERSFLNARQWLDSAVEGAGGGATVLLLANKLDLADDDLLRKVRKTEGVKLAEQFGSVEASSLFHEVSAADGRNVEAALLELAHRLREREDLDMQRAALRLTDDGRAKKKACCGGGKKKA